MKNIKIKNFLFLFGTMLTLSLFQIKTLHAENRINNHLVEAKVFGGGRSQALAWPWMAALLRTNISGSTYNKQFCGGTLIAPQWVLTAAHCTYDISGHERSDLEVLLGENDLLGTAGEIVTIDRIIRHPDYMRNPLNADIALLHIASRSSLEPVSLADTFDLQSKIGEPALAMGWGINGYSILSETPVFPSFLQEVIITLESDTRCPLSEADNVICLNVVEEKNTCGGDSGGPLLMLDTDSQQWQQIGITSGGPDCDTNGYASYTQVNKYLPFIDATINSEEFLTKCAAKYSTFVGQIESNTFICDSSFLCLNTTGGNWNIRQLSIPLHNPDQQLEYDMNGQWQKISYKDLGYCE